MKKSLIVLSSVFLLAAFLFACGDSSGDKKEETKNEGKVEDAPADGKPAGITQAEYDKAVQIIAGSDCLGCHAVTTKTNGPAYRDIAQRYEATEANIDTLANKIIHGGSGNWGQIPMQPHPDIPREDARLLAKYVLSLRDAK
ncbi:MAG TPA: c-type cytochrome [Chitinophagaceae bacterium]|nr:c-type cytochrome [Chitinophagaceae bacterium]